MDGLPKVYILDTNVLIHDPESPKNFQDNTVVLPLTVMEELDNLKDRPGDTGLNARIAARWLDSVTDQKDVFKNGIKTNGGGIILFDSDGDNQGMKRLVKKGLDNKNDNRLILTAQNWKEKKQHQKVALVTKDINLRVKARAMGVVAEDYRNDKKISRIDDLYSGLAKLPVSQEAVWQKLEEAMVQGGRLESEKVKEGLEMEKLFLNQGCQFMPWFNQPFAGEVENSIWGFFLGDHFQLIARSEIGKTFECQKKKTIGPRNIRQLLAWKLLNNPKISVVTISGVAGTGKTLLALLAGYECLEKTVQQMVVYRPNYELGQPLGFLKGGLEQKFEPWKKPILDNLKLFIKDGDKGRKYDNQKSRNYPDLSAIQQMIDQGMLTIEPINYIQGRTIHNAWLIVDEMQNFSPYAAKMILSRVGEGTKIVLTGDISQLGNPYVDEISNGLTHTIETWKGQKIFGHISLVDNERSLVADLATKLM
ncbi:MAG: PhoH family protein [Candidatus Portnoybacteria bacterium]|nr:PhoH family protein [Candidatus Portnoybacteria bacterium]